MGRLAAVVALWIGVVIFLSVAESARQQGESLASWVSFFIGALCLEGYVEVRRPASKGDATE